MVYAVPEKQGAGGVLGTRKKPSLAWRRREGGLSRGESRFGKADATISFYFNRKFMLCQAHGRKTKVNHGHFQ